jgi:hypothetical protein
LDVFSRLSKPNPEQGLVVHAYNLSTWEAEAGGWRELEANLRYIARPHLNKQTNNNKTPNLPITLPRRNHLNRTTSSLVSNYTRPDSLTMNT